MAGDDVHLSLCLCYELHYQGLPGVADGWEWEPSLVAARRRLEAAFVDALCADVGSPLPTSPRAIEDALEAILAADGGVSLSRFMLEEGTLEQFREFAVHRSAYQLKEADPHTWAIPRLAGGPKAALVRIQSDEYGNGERTEMHAELFARTMRALGLDATYGAYLDAIPGVTLATVNLNSLFGLHRRWRGALVGHLAVFEMSSPDPMARYAAALRRFGLGDEAAAFYDVHVAADAVHRIVARHDLAAMLAAREPTLAGDILFGARALVATEARFAGHLISCWQADRSSLYQPTVLAPAANA